MLRYRKLLSVTCMLTLGLILLPRTTAAARLTRAPHQGIAQEAALLASVKKRGVPFSDARGVEYVGHIDGDIRDVVVSGDHIYVDQVLGDAGYAAWKKKIRQTRDVRRA